MNDKMCVNCLRENKWHKYSNKKICSLKIDWIFCAKKIRINRKPFNILKNQ